MNRLVRSALVLGAIALSASAWAVPQKFVQQGRLLDSFGVPLEGLHNITFSIHDAPAGGNLIWVELLPVEMDNGFYSLHLGGKTPLESSLFDQDELYLQLSVDGGAPFPIRQPLASVPFALMAASADTAQSVAGGVVDASEVRVGGKLVIDGSGTLVTAAGTLSALTCANTQIVRFQGGSWECSNDISQAEVLAYVEGQTIDLQAGSTMGGDDLATLSDLAFYNGADFALSNQACSVGQTVTGVDSSGKVTCKALSGPVQLAGASTCDGDAEGTLRYDAAAKTLDLCDGESWERIQGFKHLYDFASHSFTTCGQTGRTGPSLSQCRSSYSTPWDENGAYFNMSTNGIQEWTVPATGKYRIEAYGAQGGDNSSSHPGGRGAQAQGDFDLTEGEVLRLLVGQRGASNTQHGNENGGSGGSFVVRKSGNVPILVAGGGGGAPSFSYSGNCSRTSGDGQTGTSGKTVSCYGTGTGGSGGNGGSAYNNSSCYVGGAGGGFTGNGGNGATHCTSAPEGGRSFNNGGEGGTGYSCYSPKPEGGFGGGGSGGLGAPGGGGGYSGGGAAGCWSSYADYGGGGGSYNGGTNQVNNSGQRSGQGLITITAL